MLNKEVTLRFDYEPVINVKVLIPPAMVTDTELTINDMTVFLKKHE